MNKLYMLAIGLFLFASCSKEMMQETDPCDFSEPINTNYSRAEALQGVLDYYVSRGLPGLSLAVETQHEGLWVGVSGVSRIEDQTPMQPCHLHHSASIAKTYVATLVLQLAEEGRMDLDEQAKNYLDEEVYQNIENAELATIRQLLNHTSGIYNFDDNMKAYVDTFNDPLVNPNTLSFFQKYVYGAPAYFKSGEAHRYSNTNYSLLGMIVERILGKDLALIVKEKITDPLDLAHTYFNTPEGSPDENRMVNSYFEHFPDQLQNGSDIQRHFTRIAKGHEGLIATPADFAKFMKLLVTGQVLSPEYTHLMMDDDQAFEGERYRLGIMKYETDHEYGFGHTGGSIGTICYAIYFPESEIAFSIACNLGTVFTSDNSRMFYNELFDDLLDVIFSK